MSRRLSLLALLVLGVFVCYQQANAQYANCIPCNSPMVQDYKRQCFELDGIFSQIRRHFCFLNYIIQVNGANVANTPHLENADLVMTSTETIQMQSATKAYRVLVTNLRA